MSTYGTKRQRGYAKTRKLAVHVGDAFKTSLCGQAFIPGSNLEAPTCKRCIAIKAAKRLDR